MTPHGADNDSWRKNLGVERAETLCDVQRYRAPSSAKEPISSQAFANHALTTTSEVPAFAGLATDASKPRLATSQGVGFTSSTISRAHAGLPQIATESVR
jgi:hypothetical protein